MFPVLQRVLQNVNHRHGIDRLADANSVVSAIALYPQLFTLLRGAPSDGLSVFSFSLIAGNSIVWFFYGIHRQAPPIAISSFFNAIAAISILVLIYAS